MHLQGLFKHSLLGPAPTRGGSDLAGLGQGLGIFLSGELPGDADAAGPRPHLEVTELQVLPNSSPRPLIGHCLAETGQAPH